MLGGGHRENYSLVDVINHPPAVRVIAEWIRRKVCPAPVCARLAGIKISAVTVLCVLLASYTHHMSAWVITVILKDDFTSVDVYEWTRVYQHVARHRYGAPGSQPDLFIPPPSASCRRAGNVSVIFTVNECSSAVCLFIHVPKCVDTGLQQQKMA